MESLLNELINELNSQQLNIDLLKIKSKFASILTYYEIRPTKINISNPDIQEKVKMFISCKKLEGLSQATLYNYSLELKVFGKYINKPISDISTNNIREYLSSFNNLKTSSITRKLSVLKSFFGWLVEEEIIINDPTKKIKPPKTEKRFPKALNIEELELLRESCKTLRQRALLEVYYSTGARLSEVQKLNIKDIDFNNLTTRVVGKGNNERDVFLSWKAIFHLKKYLKSRKDNCEALFTTIKHPINRLSNRGIQRVIKEIVKNAKIEKNVHIHCLRHTLATLMLNNGADLSTVQAILGHSKPETTQIYAQLTNEKKKENYKKYLVQ